MSVWINNLKMALEHKEVVIVHGNVRDKYIDLEKELIYDNFTELILDIANELPLTFSRITFYDPVKGEWVTGALSTKPQPGAPPKDEDEFAETQPQQRKAADQRKETMEQKIPPSRTLAKWSTELSRTKENVLATIFYLDKLVSYKQNYQPEEREIILRIEKLIENITPNNRLVMAALQDSMIPVELYTNSPRTRLIPISMPDKEDRFTYLKHRLGQDYQLLEIVSDLTDGLYIRDLDNIIEELKKSREIGSREIRRLINKYRIGEKQDYWGSLDLKKLQNAEKIFVETKGVKGQDEAVKKVIGVLQLARAGLTGMASGTFSKPKGVLFFAGPTGVGKTFLAKKLADFLFGSEEAFIRFDMSEFKEEHTVSKLIGSPPGYVGYEKGGLLTNGVREKPFSVILFDEIEKAHPKIMDIFLQILDEGRLTDSRGQTVFLTETVIIFTSNIGTRTTDSLGRETTERRDLDVILAEKVSEEEKRKKIQQHFTKAVEDFFMFEISRPELLNRIGNNIVPFNYIDTAERQKEIIRSHLDRIKEEFTDRFKSRGYQVEFSDSTVEYLVQRYGKNIGTFGGRAITNAIEDDLMKTISIPVLRAEYNNLQNVTFKMKAENNKIIVED
ncbi:MAG: AAA domain-containing protein [Candidatus Aminicenantes bacterium]|nr:AAA domain-containing protein [Candidatus Aminicenantes bacterium]NIM80550.1 AAA domain-containing protein [Candidatus Aminicenantes bacterium]NIN19931.1 AAA domain-containing protein [Candidatus Aminicenantes bacterium]NIN43779.1 AAA domain-containing protein [Candidatus Aminicenantes bacterium]NIN86557.1 AAA domain-containing protein [Candidatus Aminicenantes bacterium]